MDTFSYDGERGRRRVKALIIDVPQHAAVHGICIIGAKSLDVKIIHAPANFLVRGEANTNFSMLHFRVRQKILRHSHDFRYSRLVIGAKKRVAVSHDQALSFASS